MSYNTRRLGWLLILIPLALASCSTGAATPVAQSAAATQTPVVVETVPTPVNEVKEPVQGPDEKINTLAEDNQPKEEQPKNILPSTTQPETSK